MEDDFSTIKLEDIFEGIRLYLHDLEIELGIDAVCGQIGGGRAMGLSGKRSDNDFDVFYLQKGAGKPNRKCKKRISIQGKQLEVEFNFVDIGDIRKAAEQVLDKEKRNYPSIMFRGDKERAKYSPKTILPREEREDYYFTKFHWFVMGDNVWLSNKMCVADYEKFYRLERTVDALDYYYTRAYGNWNNYICNEKIINLRRYLNCIWQVLSSEWILAYGYRPTNKFDDLVRGLINEDELKKNIFDVYYTNCNSYVEKNNLFCKQNQVINKYISEKIKHQCESIKKYDMNEKVERLIERTPREYRKEIYNIAF